MRPARYDRRLSVSATLRFVNEFAIVFVRWICHKDLLFFLESQLQVSPASRIYSVYSKSTPVTAERVYEGDT